MKAASTPVLCLFALSACDPFAWSLKHAPGQLIETARAVGCQQPRSLLAADIDGDGNPDLAFLAQARGNSQKVGVRVLWGDGMGGLVDDQAWSPLDDVNTTDQTRALALGDLNKDGQPDLVALTLGSTVTVWSLFSAGPRSFQPAQELDYSACLDPDPMAAKPNTVVTADLDQDGRSELILGFEQTPGKPRPPCFLRYNGQKKLVTEFTVQSYTPESSYGIFVSSSSMNGIQDVYVSRTNTDRIWRLTNRSPSIFESAPWAQISNNTIAMTVADLNRDGHEDLVYTTNEDPPTYGRIWTVLGAANGNAMMIPGDSATSSIGITPKGVTVGDFDKDGNLDIVVLRNARDPTSPHFPIENSSPLLVLTGNGKGGFVSLDNYQDIASPQELVSANFNLKHDGFDDVALAYRGERMVAILASTGLGISAPNLRQAQTLPIQCP